MDNKVYVPEIVPEVPFPGDIAQPISQPQSGTASNPTPTVSVDKAFPIKQMALELLSTALNTRSRKILQSFELQQSGGIQIGNFEEGLAGDIRLTPNGIVARNQAGITTFGLDGTDGSAVFSGEVRSGSTVTGSVNIEDGGYLLIGDSIFLGDIASV